MAAKRKGKTSTAKQRNIFGEMREGIAAMKAHREGKLTLRTFKAEPPSLPEVDAALIRETRERLNVSRRVFARQLRVNERTLEKWEQGWGVQIGHWPVTGFWLHTAKAVFLLPGGAALSLSSASSRPAS